jgi:hypothetical protein
MSDLNGPILSGDLGNPCYQATTDLIAGCMASGSDGSGVAPASATGDCSYCGSPYPVLEAPPERVSTYRFVAPVIPGISAKAL